jgi:glycosyltransferase involved in cell wall biosynthesis
VIAVSDYEKSLLIKDFEIADEGITVIHNGINMMEFRNLDKKGKECKTLLFVGRLEEYKGVQYILQALPLLDEDVHLQIVGSGPYRTSLTDLVEQLGLGDRVEFYQGLQREELLQRYADADLFVLLSKYESFSIVIAEALAAKTPCIVANTSALSEWIDNQNCFGIDYPITVDRLAVLISETIGRQVTGVKPWDWDEVAEETVKAYEEGD